MASRGALYRIRVHRYPGGGAVVVHDPFCVADLLATRIREPPARNFVLSGTGTITTGQEMHPLRPGSVAVIPAGVLHSPQANPGYELEFVIFGTPPMEVEDERARPRKGLG